MEFAARKKSPELTEPDFWRGRGRYSKAAMLRSLKESKKKSKEKEGKNGQK